MIGWLLLFAAAVVLLYTTLHLLLGPTDTESVSQPENVVEFSRAGQREKKIS